MNFKEFMEGSGDVEYSSDYKLSQSGRKVKARRLEFKNGEDDREKNVRSEQAPVAPSLGVHRVAVTTSEPDHPMVSKRKETTQRFVKVTTNSKERAIEQGMKHFKRKGFKVHGAEHVSMVHEEAELDEKYTLAQGKPPRDSGRFTPHDQRRVDTTATGGRIHTGTVYTGKDKPAVKPTKAPAKKPAKPSQSFLDSVRKKSMSEETAGDSYEEAQKHKELADKHAEEHGKDSSHYHHAMANHHEAMGRWHESKGRTSIADKEFNKADSHHEQGVNAALKRESVSEGRSDSVLQTTAANADENAKHIFKLRDEHGIYAQQGAGASHHILVPSEHAERARKILAAHLKEETLEEGPWFKTSYGWAGGSKPGGGKYKHPDTIKAEKEARKKEKDRLAANDNPTVKEGTDMLGFKSIIEKMNLAKADMGDVIKDFKQSDAPQFAGKSDEKKRQMAIAAKLEAERGVKEEADIDEGMTSQDRERAANEADRRAAAIANNPKIAAEVERRKKAAEAAKKKPTYALGSYNVKEEAELEEAESHQSKTTMKHIPNASAALKKAAKDIKPGVAGYRDRIAMLKAGGVKEEVEQLDEKIYADEYHATSEKSQFGGHRPHVINKETGHTMFLGQHAYKKPEHAIGHAQAYLNAYAKGGMHQADNHSAAYVKANKHNLHEELKGDQHKIDKNKNGKVDAEDFKKLRKEESIDEARINGREYASHGLMHPDHAKMDIHKVSGQHVDFYATKTGDKMQGKVTKNDGKSVHIQAHKELGDGKLHKFKVTPHLPKQQNEGNDMVTYKDFIAQLNEYETDKNGKYVHKGSYGSSYQGDDDEDEDKPKKPAGEKRGRGRPAGSGSGARQKGSGSGKSYGGIATHSLNLPSSK